MKKFTFLMAAAFLCLSASAQTDSSTHSKKHGDTIRIGNIVIVRGGKSKDTNKETEISFGRKRRNSNANVSTNWWIVDIGFASFNDNTNYAGLPTGYLANRPGQPPLGSNDFKIRTGKSINVNLWFFMQKLNLVKHKVNLKYGLGLELNNYRFKSNISYKEGGVNPYPPFNNNTGAFVLRDSIAFTKNKLAADYLTIPVMLNFTTNPVYRNRGISISAGISAGYLYSQRNKQKSTERGKQKNGGDYDMERFKFSYIAELGLGPVRLYGSYSPKSMFGDGLDFKPFNIGFRLSNW
jgi:hypothetical protein